MQMREAIDAVMRGRDLSYADTHAVMRTIMTGEASDAQIGGLLIGLSMKGESIDEVTAAAQVMRELMTPVSVSCDDLVDIVGTGGDGANLFNVSTASSFVVAAAGGHVAKHGNRSVSSSSGSADLFDVAGIKLDLEPAQVARCIEQVGVGFMFAPMHHKAMRHAIGPRREMGVRTIFNILGPLTNPAGAQHQLLGVYQAELVPLMAEVLKRLGSRHVLVVHAEDGLDEVSLATPTRVAELRDGTVAQYTIAPEDFGIERRSLAPLKVVTAEDSLRLVREALAGEGEAADIVALNAGAALYACDIATSIKEGVALAQDAMDSGLAREKMKELADFARVFAEHNGALR
ncbi:anthranilate phosphoribosyltransferase [Modicisalibacter zincidurans]|uniref:Anthranilate phosphoribosyltransferase n=1 Tax=Modicisalibacter zincidurans TaxID=1178777 RepID=A0ABP9QZB6_9GAMM|nr:anthranilate phosphoribosyltransferase [Halomonas zincidurans]MEA3250094.1 anthranilate phosphoribosyltransferase [Pseudomonadota bacterium]